MRTLHELYYILFGRIKDMEYIYSLCWKIDDLYNYNVITFDEYNLLKKHFKSQKPSNNQHTDFIKHPSWKGCAWWWDIEGTDERKRFIQKMIEITKSQTLWEHYMNCIVSFGRKLRIRIYPMGFVVKLVNY